MVLLQKLELANKSKTNKKTIINKQKTNKMNKQTKLYIGIGLLGVGAYLYFRSTKNMVGMVGFTEKRLPCPPGMTMMNGRCVTNSTTKMNATGQIFAPSQPSRVFANLTSAKLSGCVHGIKAVYTPPVGGYGQGSTTFYDCKTGKQTGSTIGQYIL